MTRTPLLPFNVKPGLAPGRPGRPRKLADPQRRETLLKALEAGHTRKAACAQAGLSEDAFGRYRATEQDFADDVRQAEAKASIRHVGRILEAGDKDWRALAWWLERRFPEEWGRKNQTILTGKDGDPITMQEIPFDLTKLTDHEFATLKELVAKIDQRTGRPALVPPAAGGNGGAC